MSGRQDGRRAARTSGPTRAEQRALAKQGLTVALGVCIATGFARPARAYRRLHMLSAAAVVGFSVWHHMLYGDTARRRLRRARPETDDAGPAT